MQFQALILRDRVSLLILGLVTFHAYFLISPVVYLLGFRALVVLPITIFALCLVILISNRKIPIWALVFSSASIGTACAAGVYWESWKVALYPAYLCTSLLVVSIANDSERRKILSAGSILLIVILIGAWIAFVGALSGLPPLGQFTSATGRTIFVYLASFTPLSVGGFIRPSGIYDEPGALSFVICIVAFARQAMHMDRKITWIMLALGFVTFSLAHLVYVSIHFLSERRIFVAWTNLIIVLGLAFLGLSAAGLWEYFDTRLLDRVSVSPDSDRLIRGDNRSVKMLNAFHAIKQGEWEVFLFGIDVACVEGSEACEQDHPLMGQNPLSPLAQYGVLVAWPYYMFIAMSVIIGSMKRSWWILLAVGLLSMQRPSVLSAGYSMLAILVTYAVIRDPLFQGISAGVKGSNLLPHGAFRFRKSVS